jgi:GT2 family glycosyltransferase
MYSGNSLLAPARIFQKIRFDEKIDFVYEDLDFTYRIHRAHIPLIVLRDLKIYHMERDKTLLEQARVGHELQAYKKAKHRIVFVKKHANLIQKLQFYLLGFLGQPLRLIAKVLRHGKKGEKRKIIHAIWRGTVDGINFKL